MEHLFYPAIVGYVTGHATPDRVWRHPIHWLDPTNEEDYHPAVLKSYALWRKTSRQWPWEPRPPGLNIFGDSGGYSLVTGTEAIDPERAMRWQLRNSTMGVILDVPPYRPGSTIQFSGSAHQYWDQSVRSTLSNVRRGLRLYEKAREDDNPFRWWGCIQGETYEQLEEWHGKVSDIYPFTDEGEGWALAPKPSTDPIAIARHLRFAREHGIKKIHLLQVTSPRLVGMAFALAHLEGDFNYISFDSATATRCAINRMALVPKGGGLFAFVRQRGNAEGIVHDTIMGAPERFSKYYRDAYPLDNDEWPHYVLLYNHFVMVEAFETLWARAEEEPRELLREVTGRRFGKVLREWHGEHSIVKNPRGRKVSLFDLGGSNG